MTRQKIIIRLTPENKGVLNSVISKGTSSARTIRRAHILLDSNAECDKQYTTDELADLLNTSKQTVCRVLKEYKVSGIECIYRKKRKTPPVERKVTGDVEAHLISLACHNPLKGYLPMDPETIIRKNGRIELHRQYKPYYSRENPEGKRPQAASR